MNQLSELDKILMEDSKEFETLPDDIARCDGKVINIMFGGDIIHDDCGNCLRRTSPQNAQTVMMAAPNTLPCTSRIEVKNA